MRIPLGLIVNATQTASAHVASIVLTDADDPTCGTLSQCRTIWNIIWSCLATIFACIWLSVHPNMPLPLHTFEGLKPGNTPVGRCFWLRNKATWVGAWVTDVWSRRLPATLISLLDKLSIAHFALLAPEFIFVWSLRQRLRAGRLARQCREAKGERDRKRGHGTENNATTTVLPSEASGDEEGASAPTSRRRGTGEGVGIIPMEALSRDQPTSSVSHRSDPEGNKEDKTSEFNFD